MQVDVGIQVANEFHLSKAPIREALVDIQFQPPVTLEAIAAFVQAIPDQSANSVDLWQTLFEMRVGDPTDIAPPTGEVVGKRVTLSSGKLILSLRTTGFSLSQLEPYDTWDVLFEATSRLWNGFVEMVKPETVNRLAVRYVNVLQLPMPIEDFADYLVCPPNIPSTLPQEVVEYISRTTLMWPDKGIQCNVSQAIQGVKEDRLEYLFDIDAYSRVQRDAIDSDFLKLVLLDLRLTKNQVFRGYLTEKTVEMYR